MADETMGDLKKTVVEDEDGKIVACLYQFQDGGLHPDSWIRVRRVFNGR